MSTVEDIERLAKRVRPEDLKHVTPSDIERVAASMTPDQLEVVMKVMVRENKFGMVGKSARQDTFESAMRRVDRVSYRMASRVLLSEPHNQHSVLGKVPESWKDACEAVIRQKAWGRPL